MEQQNGEIIMDNLLLYVGHRNVGIYYDVQRRSLYIREPSMNQIIVNFTSNFYKPAFLKDHIDSYSELKIGKLFQNDIEIKLIEGRAKHEHYNLHFLRKTTERIMYNMALSTCEGRTRLCIGDNLIRSQPWGGIFNNVIIDGEDSIRQDKYNRVSRRILGANKLELLAADIQNRDAHLITMTDVHYYVNALNLIMNNQTKYIFSCFGVYKRNLINKSIMDEAVANTTETKVKYQPMDNTTAYEHNHAVLLEKPIYINDDGKLNNISEIVTRDGFSVKADIIRVYEVCDDYYYVIARYVKVAAAIPVSVTSQTVVNRLNYKPNEFKVSQIITEFDVNTRKWNNLINPSNDAYILNTTSGDKALINLNGTIFVHQINCTSSEYGPSTILDKSTVEASISSKLFDKVTKNLRITKMNPGFIANIKTTLMENDVNSREASILAILITRYQALTIASYHTEMSSKIYKDINNNTFMNANPLFQDQVKQIIDSEPVKQIVTNADSIINE